MGEQVCDPGQVTRVETRGLDGEEVLDLACALGHDWDIMATRPSRDKRGV